MDISTQSEIVLRDAGYETWISTSAYGITMCFENAAIIGFVHVFDSVRSLLAHWKERQEIILARHTVELRGAGLKAWNVYSVFLTEEYATTQRQKIAQIEENFELTRKIARASIRTPRDVEQALLPLTTIRAQPILGDVDFVKRIRSQLTDVSPRAVTAFLGGANTDDVAKLL